MSAVGPGIREGLHQSTVGSRGEGDSWPGGVVAFCNQIGCQSRPPQTFQADCWLGSTKGIRGTWPCLASPLVGFTSESMLLPGDQLHTCSELAPLRNRTKKNIKESKDEVWGAWRPGAFWVKGPVRTFSIPQSLEHAPSFFRGDGVRCERVFGKGCLYKMAHCMRQSESRANTT